VDAGNYTVEATYGGNANYSAAVPALANFAITPANATITTNNSGKVYGQSEPSPLTTATLVGFYGSDGISVTFSRAAGEGVGNYHITATPVGSVVKLGDYNITNAGATFTITQATPTVTVTDAGGTYDAAAYNASGSVTGTLADGTIGTPTFTYYSGSSTTVAGLSGLTLLSGAPVDAGNYTVEATYGGNANYSAAVPVVAEFSIGKANQTIVWNNPADILYGTPLGGTQLDATVSGVSGGSATGTVTYSPAAGAILGLGQQQTLTVNVAGTTNYNPASTTAEINVDTFQVTGITPLTNGVDIRFNGAADLSQLHLYSGEVIGAGETTSGSDGLGAPDLVLLNTTTHQIINGSLTFDATTDTAHFVATANELPAGGYSLSLVSYNSTDGWRDTMSSQYQLSLDGLDNGGTANFTSSFTVTAPTGVLVSLPNFARGPQQAVNVPNTATGLPISVSNASGLTSASFTLTYNPQLLNITGVSAAQSGWNVPTATFHSIDATHETLTVTDSGTSLPAGAANIFNLTASVPSGASYGASAALQLSGVSLSGTSGSIAAAAGESLEKVAFVGDVTGNEGYSALDASLIARVVVGLDSGFDSYRLTDPVIVGDVTGDGTLSGLDAAYVAEAAVGTTVQQIPAIPSGTQPITPNPGADPAVTVGNVVTAPGGTVTVPVSIGSFSGLQAADFTFDYNQSLVTMSNSDVTLGGVPSGWFYVTNVGNGLVRVSLYTTAPVSSSSTGTLLNLTAHVASGAASGTVTPVTIAPGPTPSALNEGELALSSTNGSITIAAPTLAKASVFYYGSKFDGNGSTPQTLTNDLNAVASDKSYLLPGQQATFANVTSYTGGINGLLLDFANMSSGTVLNANSDFSFAVSNTGSSWTALGTLPNIVMGTDPTNNGDVVADLVWSSGAATNEWLQVTVKATANTGLTSPATFYFGNLIGATGASTKNGKVLTVSAVDASNAAGAVGSLSPTSPGAVTSLYDFNRDGKITAVDASISAGEVGQHALTLFASAPAGPAAQPAGVSQLASPTAEIAAVSAPAALSTVTESKVKELTSGHKAHKVSGLHSSKLAHKVVNHHAAKHHGKTNGSVASVFSNRKLDLKAN
jgi:hypothetical protein